VATSKQHQSEDKIHLGECIPFGVGGRRVCYVHPGDASKCIKILRQDSGKTVRLDHKGGWIPNAWRRSYDNNAHEKQKLLEIYRAIGPSMAQHLPICHGQVDTDLGKGLVLDLIRDQDGGISRSLREWITLGIDLVPLKPFFQIFGNFLVENSILTRQILDHNLALQRTSASTWNFFLIDGIGDSSWLPLARWIPALGRARIKRKVAAAWPRFEALASEGGVSEEMRRNSTWGQGILQHRDSSKSSLG
jgi:hypothetical protein